MKKKLLSILLAAVLAVSMALPALSASAEETPAGSTVSESVSIGDSTHSYSVTLPKGYQKDSGRSYPVVYLLPDDGRSAYQNDVVKLYEDAMASAGGIDMILVTTGFSANDDFRAVMKAIAEDVDTKYDTIAEAKYRTAAGTGTGGYMAYILGFTSADGGAPLTTPETFGSIISIRGNFVDNIWYAKYGDVYDILTAAKTSSSKFYNNFYTYLDAPTEDAWSAMTHSTNELGSLFISWSSAHSYNVHEFTTRNGVYNKAFLEESVARVMDRLANNLVPVTSGTVSVSPPRCGPMWKTPRQATRLKSAATLRSFSATVRPSFRSPLKLPILPAAKPSIQTPRNSPSAPPATSPAPWSSPTK